MSYWFTLPALLAFSSLLLGWAAPEERNRLFRRGGAWRKTGRPPTTSPSPSPTLPYEGGGDLNALVGATVGALAVVFVLVLVAVVIVVVVRVRRRCRERKRAQLYDEVGSPNGSISRSSTLQLLAVQQSPRHLTLPEWPTQPSPAHGYTPPTLSTSAPLPSQLTPSLSHSSLPHCSLPQSSPLHRSSPPLPPRSPVPIPLVITNNSDPPLHPPPSLPPDSPFCHDYSEVDYSPNAAATTTTAASDLTATTHLPCPPTPNCMPLSPIYDEVTMDCPNVGVRESLQEQEHLYCSVPDVSELEGDRGKEGEKGQQFRPCVDHNGAPEPPLRQGKASELCRQFAVDGSEDGQVKRRRWKSTDGLTPLAEKEMSFEEAGRGRSEADLAELPRVVDPYRISVLAPSWLSTRKPLPPKPSSFEEESTEGQTTGSCEERGGGEGEGEQETDFRLYATLEPVACP